MLLIKSPTNNPYFNIAAEEYLLKHSKDDVLFLYRNTPSVIIGKHQNLNLEVNIPYVIEKGIPIIRRISGGGSVYHDANNLNYSMITSSEKAWVDFEKFTQPLVNYLSFLGLLPELRSKSDIRLAGKKISGNASHIFKDTVMHHGSILFATDLEKLTEALKNKPSCYRCKTVNSRRSIVTNIVSHLPKTISLSDFESGFIHSLYANGLLSCSQSLSKEAKSKIELLAIEKYYSSDWNVFYNANYIFQNTFLHKNTLCSIRIEIEKGICKTTTTNSTFLKDIQHIIKNVPHETTSFLSVLSPYFTPTEILKYFF